MRMLMKIWLRENEAKDAPQSPTTQNYFVFLEIFVLRHGLFFYSTCSFESYLYTKEALSHDIALNYFLL